MLGLPWLETSSSSATLVVLILELLDCCTFQTGLPSTRKRKCQGTLGWKSSASLWVIQQCLLVEQLLVRYYGKKSKLQCKCIWTGVEPAIAPKILKTGLLKHKVTTKFNLFVIMFIISLLSLNRESHKMSFSTRKKVNWARLTEKGRADIFFKHCDFTLK